MSKKSLIGKKIRQIRKTRDMSLTELAKNIDKTKGYLSQVERGHIEPSIEALRNISEALEVPMFYLLMDNKNNRKIVRKDERKALEFGNSDLSYELLCPDLNHEMEVIQVKLNPGASPYEQPISHEGEEFILVLSGLMEIQLENEVFTLEEGDSIYFMGGISHKTTNLSKEEELIFISAVTPPHF